MTSGQHPVHGRLQAISPDREDLRKAGEKAAKTAGSAAKFFGCFMISLMTLALFFGEALANLGGLGLLVPEKKELIGRFGLKCVLAASLSNLMSAALAGLLLTF